MGSRVSEKSCKFPEKGYIKTPSPSIPPSFTATLSPLFTATCSASFTATHSPSFTASPSFGDTVEEGKKAP
jgi:hypothetical protein